MAVALDRDGFGQRIVGDVIMSTTITVPEKVYTGMGATPHEAGVAFRVWAPHADAVYVVGSFNDWAPDAHPMSKEEDGYWYADIASAAIGNEYRYRIVTGDKELLRIDPYARQVTSSVGNAVVYDPQLRLGRRRFPSSSRQRTRDL